MRRNQVGEPGRRRGRRTAVRAGALAVAVVGAIAVAHAIGTRTTTRTVTNAEPAPVGLSLPLPHLPTTSTTTVALPPAGTPLPRDDVVFDGGDGHEHYQLYVMHQDGTGLRPLTNSTTYNSWWPRPSPDRTRILFYRTPRNVKAHTYMRAELWSMNADGTDAHVVFPEGVNGWTFQAHANWSPDGTRIVFMAGATRSELYTSAPDGRDLQPLAAGPGPSLDPGYSADGRWIVYVSCPTASCSPDRQEVYVIAADGRGTPRRLTDDGLRDNDPSISPDGRTVAILTETSPSKLGTPYGTWQIRTVGFDGTDLRTITSGLPIESAPQWSHDGTRIWTHRLAGPTVWDVVSMNPDGSGLTVLALPNTQEDPIIS